MADSDSLTDNRLLLLAPADNVLVACVALGAGTTLQIDGEAVTLAADIGMAHKLARRDLAAGIPVIKYGAPIGSTTAAVAKGDHVHLDNMKSDYIATVNDATAAVYDGKAT